MLLAWHNQVMKSWFSAFVAVLISTAGAFAQAPVGVPAAPPASGLPPAGGPRIPSITTWGYQLQHGDPDVVAASPFDLVVIDYSRSGDEGGRFSKDDVAKMKVKPDGSRRIVLAYMSIGEAENYRYYWNDEWVEPVKLLEIGARPKGGAGRPQTLNFPKLAAPLWLGRENANWKGNFLVRYWDKGWQDIIFGNKDGYLERIIAAGFDGVYLDRVDVYYNAELRSSAKDDMVRFVVAIAKQARKLNPQFAIVPQNAEELLAEPEYLAAIDAQAKEDLFYGQVDGQPNSTGVVQFSLDRLAPARKAGLPVLVVEYIRNPSAVTFVRGQILDHGFVPYFALRSLDRLITLEEMLGTATKPLAPGAPPLDKGKQPPVPAKKERGR